jgi:hypothetical protein
MRVSDLDFFVLCRERHITTLGCTATQFRPDNVYNIEGYILCQDDRSTLSVHTYRKGQLEGKVNA